MRATNWTDATTAEEAAKRAAGRRRFNRWRQLLATQRLGLIVDILTRNGWTGREWGIRAKIARELGVSRSTVARDMQHVERSLVDASYAAEWRQFYRWWRRTYGDGFGPHPGTVFPQMDRSTVKMPRSHAVS